MPKKHVKIKGDTLPFFLTVNCCPACGERPIGVVKEFTGYAGIRLNNDRRSFEWTRELVVERGAMRLYEANGQITLVCGGGHQWHSEIKEES